MQDVQTAEQIGGQYAYIGTPYGKDDQGNCQPASVAESVICPNAACVVHNIVKTTETCYHTTDAGSQILVAVDIDAGGVCSGGVFADCPQMKTGTSTLNDVRRNEGDGNGQIHKKTVAEEEISDYPANPQRPQIFCSQNVAMKISVLLVHIVPIIQACARCACKGE